MHELISECFQMQPIQNCNYTFPIHPTSKGIRLVMNQSEKWIAIKLVTPSRIRLISSRSEKWNYSPNFV